eukprot:11285406-Ditylum_brightwellii.AAC.1
MCQIGAGPRQELFGGVFGVRLHSVVAQDVLNLRGALHVIQRCELTSAKMAWTILHSIGHISIVSTFGCEHPQCFLANLIQD